MHAALGPSDVTPLGNTAPVRHVNRRLVERAKLVGALTRRSDLAARGVTDPGGLAENDARIVELEQGLDAEMVADAHRIASR